MPRGFDLEQTRHIAALARLGLADGEIEGLTADLRAIVGYVEKLNELDTSLVPPTTHAVELTPVEVASGRDTKLRDDVVVDGLPVEQGLALAPERIGDGFGVPKIVE